MACKPKLGMKKVLEKENKFYPGSSQKEVAKELNQRMGGGEYLWEKEVSDAVKNGTFIFCHREGLNGFRTQTSSEREKALAPAPTLVYSSQMVAAS